MSFDNELSNKPINILKASLPYVPPGMQRPIVSFMKALQFNLMFHSITSPDSDTLYACGINPNEEQEYQFKPKDLLQAIKPFLNSAEKEKINSIFNMMQAMQLYNAYNSNLSEDSNDMYHSDYVKQNEHQAIHNAFSEENKPLDPFPEFQYDFNKFKKNEDVLSNQGSLHTAEASQSSHSKENPFNSSNHNTSNNSMNIEALKQLLNPNQRAMFDACASLMNNNNNNTAAV